MKLSDPLEDLDPCQITPVGIAKGQCLWRRHGKEGRAAPYAVLKL